MFSLNYYTHIKIVFNFPFIGKMVTSNLHQEDLYLMIGNRLSFGHHSYLHQRGFCQNATAPSPVWPQSQYCPFLRQCLRLEPPSIFFFLGYLRTFFDLGPKNPWSLLRKTRLPPNLKMK